MTYNESERSKRKIFNTIKSDAEKALDFAIKKGFPDCKGAYPDCPEAPNKNELPCKNCPVLEDEDY